MNKIVREVTDSSFEHEVLQADRPVLVDFLGCVVRTLPNAGADD